MTPENLLILFNIFIIESLLSIDNAAVLAVMVKDLPINKQAKALRYGIIGAFAFRGLGLFLASWLIKILWLKLIGGAYLLRLVYLHFESKKEDENIDKDKNKNGMGIFWSTVILVEIMDMAFSVDNIFAVVAMTNNYFLILTGVCIGIVAMRFVAQWFTVLIRKYPTLENSAFIVIAILGFKLIISSVGDYSVVFGVLKPIIESRQFDLLFSVLMIIVFVFPIMRSGNIKKATR